MYFYCCFYRKLVQVIFSLLFFIYHWLTFFLVNKSYLLQGAPFWLLLTAEMISMRARWMEIFFFFVLFTYLVDQKVQYLFRFYYIPISMKKSQQQLILVWSFLYRNEISFCFIVPFVANIQKNGKYDYTITFEIVRPAIGRNIQFLIKLVTFTSVLLLMCFLMPQPTFLFFQHGEKVAEIVGADVSRLKTTMEQLYK